MAVQELMTFPNDILFKKSAPVTNSISKKYLEELLVDMMDTMKANRGVGLAAPQIGVSLQIFVIVDGLEKLWATESLKIDGGYYIMNPRLLDFTTYKTEVYLEGCLSFPSSGSFLARHLFAECIGDDLSFKNAKLTGSDYAARVLEHEYDHLQGITMPERAVLQTQVYGKRLDK